MWCRLIVFKKYRVYLSLLAISAITFIIVLPVWSDGLVQLVSQEQLLKRLDSSSPPLVLDVRTPSEYSRGHVPNAINIPHTELSRRINEIASSKDRDVVVYCEAGVRASIAENILVNQGFHSVLHLDGDMSSWRRNALPLEKPD